LATLNQAVEYIEDGVAAPGIGVIAQELCVFGGRVGASDAISVAAEGLKLVDELVYYVPGPVVLIRPISCPTVPTSEN